MITVSDGFKKAIKDSTREIYGYVDIQYQNNNYEKSINSVPTTAPIVKSDGSGLLSNNKVIKKYATLENNYTLLNGASIVWNDNIINTDSYISDKVFNEMTNKTFVINNLSPTISSKGITIYFKDNIPFDFNINVYNSSNEIITQKHITNNTSKTYQYIFDNEITFSKVSITINSVEFSNNRIRIAYIDFSLGDLYDGDELISFNVNEELDLLIENLPINTCSISINNYPNDNGNKFDPINPKGIVKYLNSDVTIQPFVGVLTEDNGIEYVAMGEFFLSDWSSNVDGNVTLNGQSILGKLNGLKLKTNGDFLRKYFNSSYFATYLKNVMNIDTNFITYSAGWVNNDSMSDFDFMEYLKCSVIIMLFYDYFTQREDEYRKFYVDRNNKLTLNKLSFSSKENVDKHELLKDVEYLTNDRIKTLYVVSNTVPQLSRSTDAQKEICSEITHTLNSKVEYLWLTTDKYTENGSGSLQITTTNGSCSGEIIDYNYKSIYVKLTGTVGSIVNIKYYNYVYTNSNSIGDVTKTINNNSVNTGESVTVDITKYIDVKNISTYWSTTEPYKFDKIYFNLNKPYKITAETIGNPSLEIGDTISIETRYGYKNMIITKQQFKYDGGLSCSLEGMGD